VPPTRKAKRCGRSIGSGFSGIELLHATASALSSQKWCERGDLNPHEVASTRS
jgi:hypothetical protein